MDTLVATAAAVVAFLLGHLAGRRGRRIVAVPVFYRVRDHAAFCLETPRTRTRRARWQRARRRTH